MTEHGYVTDEAELLHQILEEMRQVVRLQERIAKVLAELKEMADQ